MHSAKVPNAGFPLSEGGPVRPVFADGPLWYRRTNAADREADPRSLRARVTEMSCVRQNCPEIDRGEWRVVEGLPDAVLGLHCAWQGDAVLTLLTLSGDAGSASLPDAPCRRRLGPSGCRWVRPGGARR